MSVLLNAGEIGRAIRRISHEILEKNHGSDDVVLLGIPTRGAYLSRRIAEEMAAIEKSAVNHGILDITMYRDDLRMRTPRPLLPTEILLKESMIVTSSSLTMSSIQEELSGPHLMHQRTWRHAQFTRCPHDRGHESCDPR